MEMWGEKRFNAMFTDMLNVPGPLSGSTPQCNGVFVGLPILGTEMLLWSRIHFTFLIE